MNRYMDLALKEAKKAFKKDEIPVGAVIVYKDKVIAKAHNIRQKTHNVLGHAEIIAILKAARKLKDWRLNDCDLYVTLKPCSMCDAVINESRIRNVFFILNKPNTKKEYYKVKTTQTYVCDEYGSLLYNFFENKRIK